ncbi:MAG: DUF268 domain-containing protein [Chloroflexota bacterium]
MTHRNIRKFRRVWRLWIDPVLPATNIAYGFQQYIRYFYSWKQYTKLPGAERLRLRDGFPCLFDAVQTTPFDTHYFHQAVWAARHIAQQAAPFHIDIGSDTRFVGLLTTHKPIVFLDYRPLKAKIPGLHCLAGDILHLPFQAESIPSLSCLHVVEHVGLGRYGDPLNPLGTQQACAELARVLSPGGSLFFSTPTGQTRTHFNAHRIHNPRQILSFFAQLELVEFSAVDDRGQVQLNANLNEFEKARYACGLFWFRRNL